MSEIFEALFGFVTHKLLFKPSEDGSQYSVDWCKKDIKKVQIPSTFLGKPVTGISSQAFSNCTSLTNITIKITNPSMAICMQRTEKHLFNTL